jgi:hypothetical protein
VNEGASPARRRVGSLQAVVIFVIELGLVVGVATAFAKLSLVAAIAVFIGAVLLARLAFWVVYPPGDPARSRRTDD